MCDTIEHGNGVPKNILIEFQRDSSMRSTSIVIVGRTHTGAEEEGVKIIVSDKGNITVGKPAKLIDGVDVLI